VVQPETRSRDETMTKDAIETCFIKTIAANPNEITDCLVYADWLEERGDHRANFIRLWAELCESEYGEGNYVHLRTLIDRYQETIQTTDRPWLEKLARARPWISRETAVLLVRVYLRTRHGRKKDRQWIELGWQPEFPPGDTWHVYYWRQKP